jgi:hypothetical protein
VILALADGRTGRTVVAAVIPAAAITGIAGGARDYRRLTGRPDR